MVNFVRVLIGAVFFWFSCTGERNVLRVQGGEVQRGSLTQFSGYSDKAQCIGKRSYLEPISGSMQKPIEGLSKKIEDRVTIGEETAQKHVENYIKGGYRKKSHNSTASSCLKLLYTPSTMLKLEIHG